jgi:hypothetical protein
MINLMSLISTMRNIGIGGNVEQVKTVDALMYMDQIVTNIHPIWNVLIELYLENGAMETYQ